MLDHDRARPQRLRRVPEEGNQRAVLETLDVDFECVNLCNAGVVEDALQSQRRHPDRLAGNFTGDDMAGAEIVAIGFDHQFAIGGAGGGSHQFDLRIA